MLFSVKDQDSLSSNMEHKEPIEIFDKNGFFKDLNNIWHIYYISQVVLYIVHYEVHYLQSDQIFLCDQ